MANTSSSRELAVLAQVEEALAGLDQAGARRVLTWLNDKYELKDEHVQSSQARTAGSLVAPRTPIDKVDFPTLYARVQPQTDKERALLAGYWFQVIGGEADLDSQALNKELKNLGHPISNVTKALSYLIEQRPQLVIQTRKSGGSQQARKKYRLTTAGIEEVETMLSRSSTR